MCYCLEMLALCTRWLSKFWCAAQSKLPTRAGADPGFLERGCKLWKRAHTAGVQPPLASAEGVKLRAGAPRLFYSCKKHFFSGENFALCPMNECLFFWGKFWFCAMNECLFWGKFWFENCTPTKKGTFGRKGAHPCTSWIRPCHDSSSGHRQSHDTTVRCKPWPLTGSNSCHKFTPLVNNYRFYAGTSQTAPCMKQDARPKILSFAIFDYNLN
jgi:hypothetical protein